MFRYFTPALVFFILLSGCSNASDSAPATATPQPPSQLVMPARQSDLSETPSTYAGSSTQSRAYDYDVSGADANGNSVTGSIDVTRNGGEGTVTDENGNEHEVEVEWKGRGQLEGTDENGETYELEVD